MSIGMVNEGITSLQHIAKLLSNGPFIVVHLVPPEFHVTIASDGVHRVPIFQGKLKHVVC